MEPFSTCEDKLDMQIKIIYMRSISIRGWEARIFENSLNIYVQLTLDLWTAKYK